MRTTLDIDDDVLGATKDLARRRHVPTGRMVSDLLRKALLGDSFAATGGAGQTGFQPFPPRGVVVSNDQIDNLRDREGV